jgi:hypothetical protein
MPAPVQSASSPLDQLADIHLPDGVSWWPLAPGWWILLTLVILLAIGFFIWRKRKARNNYRLIAQQELARIYGEYQSSQNAAAYLQALSLLLRRTALTAYPRTFNASIKGNEWLQWLGSVCPESQGAFSGETGKALLIGPYQKNPQVDVGALQQLSELWISKHRNQYQKIKAAKIQQQEAAHV